MSMAEVLTAALALPREEQLELARTLTDEPPTTTPVRPESDAELLRRLVPVGGQFEVWSPLETTEAAQVLQRLLDDNREGK